MLPSRNIKVMIIAFVLLSSLSIGVDDGWGFLSDSASYPPPSSGPYTYSPPGNFMPGNTGFPKAGSSYVDPVFGGTVTRITDNYPVAPFPNNWVGNNNYSDPPQINADNTMVMANRAYYPNIRVYNINTSPPRLVRETAGFANVGEGHRDYHWHPTESNVIVLFNGLTLKKYNVITDRYTTLHTFSNMGGATSCGNGGSSIICDSQGRYYAALTRSGTSPIRLIVWDSVLNIEYTPVDVSGTAADTVDMVPDGSGILVSTNDTRRIQWRALDHTTKMIGSGYTIVSGPSGGASHHSCVVDTDGKAWLVLNAGGITSPVGGMGVYKISVTNKNNYVKLFDVNSQSQDWSLAYHNSSVRLGPDRDWVAFSWDYGNDNVSDLTPWNNWKPYRNEIMMVNTKTGELRRLCHHRSRLTENYYAQPKASVSWDGSLVAFSSNMGRTGGDNAYCDLYIVTTGLGHSAARPKISK